MHSYSCRSTSWSIKCSHGRPGVSHLDKTSVMFDLVLQGTIYKRIFLFSVVGRVLPDDSKGPIAFIFRIKQSGKNKAIHTFEISGTTYPTTQRQIQETRKLQQHCSQKLKSRKTCISCKPKFFPIFYCHFNP